MEVYGICHFVCLKRVPRLVLILFLSVGLCRAELKEIPKVIESPNGVGRLELINTPEYLYHWTSYQKLEEIAEHISKEGLWTEFESGYDHSFGKKWPVFFQKNVEALFAFHNVGATHGGAGENYGEILIRLKIAPSARVYKAVDQYQQFGAPKNFDGADAKVVRPVDIVLNEAPLEYVILNPESIVSFTADPALLESEIDKMLNKLKDNSYKFERSDVHMGGISDPFERPKPISNWPDNGRNYIVYRLENYRNTPREVIPRLFLDPSYSGPHKARDARRQYWRGALDAEDAIVTIEELPYFADSIEEDRPINDNRLKTLHLLRMRLTSASSWSDKNNKGVELEFAARVRALGAFLGKIFLKKNEKGHLEIGYGSYEELRALANKTIDPNVGIHELIEDFERVMRVDFSSLRAQYFITDSPHIKRWRQSLFTSFEKNGVGLCAYNLVSNI